MRKADSSNGFLLCFFMNLVLHFEWAIAVIVLIALHFWLDLPWFLAYIALAIWLLESLLLTVMVTWGNESAQVRDPPKENKNPYSATTAETFKAPGRKKPDGE